MIASAQLQEESQGIHTKGKGCHKATTKNTVGSHVCTPIEHHMFFITTTATHTYISVSPKVKFYSHCKKKIETTTRHISNHLWSCHSVSSQKRMHTPVFLPHAPLKIKIFQWYLRRGVILTKDNLAK